MPTTEAALAIIGTIASIGLALSPVPTIRTIIVTKSTGKFSILPYSVTCVQAIVWVMYGIMYGEGKHALIRVNIPVSLIELGYVIVFFRFAEVSNTLLSETLAPVIVLAVGIVVLFFLDSDVVKALGIMAMVFNIAVYASPLSAAITVVKTKSVEYMPLLLSLAGTVSAIIWLAWAWLVEDLYVLIPSSIGTVLGLAQLGIYAYYRRNSTSIVEAEENTALVN